MARLAAVVYGLVCYAIAFAAMLYAIGFVEGLVVPKTIDSGPAGAIGAAVVVDALLLCLFALQHSVMARPAFKRGWTRFIPQPIERSTYVLFAALTLIGLFVFWRPAPQVLWAAHGAPAAALWALSALGWLIALSSSFLTGHFELFGLKQVFGWRAGRVPPAPEFRTPLLYRVVRHPLYLGFLLAFWAAPVMSVGRLVFAAGMTVYVLAAIQFEERDLVAVFGDTYRSYQKRVSMILPWVPKRKA